jgi:uncharacterized RDD family membrane protein YckC
MTHSSETLQIDTPENVTFDYAVAGIGSRFLAALADTFLLVMLQVILLGALYLVAVQLGLFDDIESTWILALFSLLAFLFFWGYYIFFEILWNGQTPGKRWVSIRVIRLDGTPVNAAEVVIRNLVRIIDLLPTAYGVGVVTMFVTDKSRRLGDLAAGTVVVHERPAVELVEGGDGRLSRLSSLNPNNPVPDGFPVGRLGEHDLQMIEDFLMRRYHLPNREKLAAHILNSLCTQLGYSGTIISQREADDVLAAIYKAARALREA